MSNHKIVLMMSGKGSNIDAIFEHKNLKEHVVGIIANKHSARHEYFSEKYQKPFWMFEQDFEKKTIAVLDNIDKLSLIVLCGFTKILSKDFCEKYPQKIINIHPSLLPDFKGFHTHKRVLEAGLSYHGCSVHYVNEKLDDGEIIGQQDVTVFDDDTVEILKQRVLKAENSIYPCVIWNLLHNQTTKEN